MTEVVAASAPIDNERFVNGNRERLLIVDVFNTDRAANALGARRAELINQSGRYENLIVCSDGPCVELLRARGIRVLTTPIPRKLAPLATWRCVRNMTRLLQGVDCSVVHSHGSTAALCARLAARRAGVPAVVHTVHGFHFHKGMPSWRYRFYAAAERLLTRYTDVLSFQNREDLDEATELGIRAAHGNILVGNGIDLRRFGTQTECAPDEPPAILMIARFEPVKNQAMLLHAASLLAKRGCDFQVWFAGSGPTLDRMRQLAVELGLTDRVHFLGYTLDMPALIRRARIAVLTAVKEGIPRGLLEPMAAGLPVVATDVKGNRETVMDGRTGWLVPLNDHAALAQRLEQLLADDTLRQQMGQNAARRVREAFDEERVVERLMSIYDRLHGDKNGFRTRRVDSPRHEPAEPHRPVTLAEIPALCHRGKLHKRSWYHLHRRLSTPLTWCLHRLRVSPNVVSACMVFVGLLGALALALPSVWFNLGGVAAMYFAFLLDKVDGDLARLTRLRSPHGLILDYAYHRLTTFSMYAALGVRAYEFYGNPISLLLGTTAGFLANYSQDAQMFPYRLYAQKVLCGNEPWQLDTFRRNGRREVRERWIRPLKMFSHPLLLLPIIAGLSLWPAGLPIFLTIAVGSLAVFTVVQHWLLFRGGLAGDMAGIERQMQAKPPESSPEEVRRTSMLGPPYAERVVHGPPATPMARALSDRGRG